MRRFQIGSRLAFSFVVVLLLMVVGSGIGLWQYNVVRTQAERLQQVDSQAMAVLRVYNRMLMLQEALESAAEAENAVAFTEQAENLQEDVIVEVDQALDSLQVTEADAAQNRAAIAQFEALLETLPDKIEALIRLAEAGDWVAVELRMSQQFAEDSEILGRFVDEIDRQVAEERAQVQANMAQAYERAMWFIIGSGVLAFLMAGILGLVVTRSIAVPLVDLDVAAQSLAEGDFDKRVTIEGEDELAHLGRAFNEASAQLAELYNHMEELVRQRTEELHYRALQLETSIAVGQRIISILDLDTLLNQVAELIQERYGYYYVGISLMSEDGEQLVARAGTGDVGARLVQAGHRHSIGADGIIGETAKRRRPVLVNDFTVDPRHQPEGAFTFARAGIALPLEMGGQLLGVLDIHSDRAHRFAEEDVPVLQLLANEVAIAIQNASLYKAERARRRLAETLYDIGQALSGTLQLDEVLNLILQYLKDIVPYDRGAVLMRQGDVLGFTAAQGFPADVDPLTLTVAIEGNDVYQDIVQTREPLAIPDISRRPDWNYTPELPPAQSWLGVPLIRSGEVFGMLSLVREAPDPYTEEEVTLAGAFAGQAAIALENAQLYEQITRFNRELEQKVAERTRELQEAYARLERLDRAKSDFITVTSHELRTPLTVLRGYSSMLMKDDTIKENPFHHRMVSSIHTGTMRMYEIVNTMLDMVKIDSGALKLYPEPFSVAWLLDNVVESFRTALKQRNLELVKHELATLGEIQADMDGLKKVFQNLIGNAIKYTPDGGVITISGRRLSASASKLGQEAVEIVVRDTGIGIDPSAQELIFEKFYQTGEVSLHSSGKTQFKAGGPGLGLAIVQGIVEAHRGKIWVESPGHDEETCPGSTFYVQMPVRQSFD
jgi:signal transduction histidine kinase